MSYYDRDRKPFTDASGNVYAAKTMNHPMTHHGNVAEYQSSGFPFAKTIQATLQAEKVEFPFVTQWIQIFAADVDRVIYISFSATGMHDGDDASSGDPSPDNYIELHNAAPNTDATQGHNPTPNKTGVWRLKCKEIYIKASGDTAVSIIAGMTNVPSTEFPDLTGLDGVG